MKKLIPIIITILFAGYLGIMFIQTFLTMLYAEGIGKVFMGIVALFFIGTVIALIYILVERIKEIDKEDDDDISKY